MDNMMEIRWHGRGGNGAFTAAKLLGLAASVFAGKYAQAFPSFGPERRGAPVLGFTRISDIPITDHSHVYECDHVIVLDETLCETVDVTVGLKEDGLLLINSKETQETLTKKYHFGDLKRILTIDATGIARDFLGMPIVNTVMLGALTGATNLVPFTSLESAMDEMLPAKISAKNKSAASFAYHKIQGGDSDDETKI